MKSAAGPRGLGNVLNFMNFAKHPLSNMMRLHRTYGPVVMTGIAGERFLFFTDPDLINEFLVKQAARFKKDRFTGDLKVILGEGLLTSEGALWRQQRKLIAPSLQPRHIAAYADSMASRTMAYAAGLKDGETRDLHEDLAHLTLDIVVDTLFGTELPDGMENVGELLEGIMHNFSLLVRSWRRFIPRSFPQPTRTRLARYGRQLDEKIQKLVTQKQAEGATGDDLLSRLLSARDDEGHSMDERQLRDEVITMFGAGHETTALAVTFALYLLALHPEAADRVAAEVAQVCGAAQPGAADVAKLPFTGAVVRETMRLYPPAWIFGREALEDCEIGGYEVRKGWQVIANTYVIHRNPEHFPQPDAFRPDRWMDGLADRLPRHTYQPFGGGPRICIGNHFAMMEAVLLLAVLTRHARFELPEDFQLGLKPSITLRPDGAVPATVRLR